MKKTCLHFKSGFTIIEIIAAMAVLSILALVLVKIMGVTTQSTALSNHVIDTASQSRLVLDRLGQDLAGIIVRKDVDFKAQNTLLLNTDILSFFSTVSSSGVSGNNRGISFISYQIRSLDNPRRPCLVRYGKAIGWTNDPSKATVANGFIGLKADSLPVSLSDLTFPAALRPAPADFDVLSPGVIRLVVGFQLYPDDLPVTLSDSTVIANARGQIVYSPPVRILTPLGGGAPVNYIDLSRISAIVAAVVAIDLDNLKLVDETQISAMAEIFVTPATGVLPVNSWTSVANNAATNPALNAVPLPVRQTLRVFQRFYSIRPFVPRGNS